MPAAITYVLGKDCVLKIDGAEVKGVSDVSVRETVTEIDASGFNGYGASTVVVGRSYEILFSVPDIAKARVLLAKRWQRGDVGKSTFYLPQILDVELTGGLFEISRPFTIHGIEGDEPLNDAVISRFELREWNYIAPPIPEWTITSGSY
jgi:hypothetical protein